MKIRFSNSDSLSIANTVKLSLFKINSWKLRIPNRDVLWTLRNIYDDHLCPTFKHLSWLGFQIHPLKISQSNENMLQTFIERTGKAIKTCWKAITKQAIPDLCGSYLNMYAFFIKGLSWYRDVFYFEMEEQKGCFESYVLRFENSFWQNVFLFIWLCFLQYQVPGRELPTV